MRSVRRAIAILVVGFVIHGANAAGQEVSVDDLLEMWSQRQLATKSAEFHWVEKVESDGERVAYDCTLRLGSDSLIRSDRIPSEKRLAPDESLTRPGLAISCFDGDRNRYYTSAIGPGDHPRGIEFDAEHYDEIVNYHLRAILIAYRPLYILPAAYSPKDSRIVRSDAKLAIVEQAVLDGVTCLVIGSQTDDNALVRERYWIDTARQGLVLKHIELVGDRQTAEMAIKYKKDPSNGWVPLIWRAKFMNTTVEGRVTKHKINQRIDPEIFEIDYPKGTVVFDRDLSIQDRVQADGSRSRVTPAGKSK